jgi:hypothetical protein
MKTPAQRLRQTLKARQASRGFPGARQQRCRLCGAYEQLNTLQQCEKSAAVRRTDRQTKRRPLTRDACASAVVSERLKNVPKGLSIQCTPWHSLASPRQVWYT